MAHPYRKVTSKDRNDTVTIKPYPPVSRQGLRSRLLQLVRKIGPSQDALPRKSRIPEPYEDFDLLLTAGHNIG